MNADEKRLRGLGAHKAYLWALRAIDGKEPVYLPELDEWESNPSTQQIIAYALSLAVSDEGSPCVCELCESRRGDK